ncbi:MAG: hypothetical protein JKY94_10415 [Rhodobacteraceae bacterium]|nr:hypothetical protein [Paracoccaceae bacterium]
MNEVTKISTALALPEKATLAAMFKAENGLDPLMSEFEEAALAEAEGLSVDTKKGRDEIISVAFKASKSKAEMARQAKALTETQRAEIAAVVAGMKTVNTRMDALRDKIRKPVDDWEAAKEAETERLKDRLSELDAGRADAFCSTEQISVVIASIEAVEMGEDWGDYLPVAEIAKAKALHALRANLVSAQDRENKDAELIRLRAESAERAEADRKAQAERDRLAAIETAKVEEERVAKRKAERAAQAERDRVESANRARTEAEEKAALDKLETAARHKRELEESRAREEAAAQAERDRLADERKAEANARAKREADREHLSKIRSDISGALAAMAGAASPDQITEALMSGKIPHCEVKL